MVERGLNTNHMMIAEFTNSHKMDAKNIGETIFKLHEKIEHLQAQIYDLQNQNYEYEYRFKRMSLAADLRSRRLDHLSVRVSLCLRRGTTSLHHEQLHHHHLRRRRHKHMGMALPVATAKIGGGTRYRITITLLSLPFS